MIPMFNSNNGYSLADIAAATRSSDGAFGDGNGAWWIIILFLFAFNGWGGFGGGWGGNGGVSGPAYQSAVTRDTIAYDFDINDLKSSIAANGASIANGFYNLNTGLLTGLSGTNAAISSGVNAIQSDICQQGIAGLQNTNGILQAINANTVAGMQNTYGLTTQLNAMQAAQEACCCDTRQLIANEFARLGYNLATEECATRQNSSDAARSIIDNANANTRSILDFLTQDRLSALNAENAALKTQISQSEQNAYLVEALRPQANPAYIVANPYTGQFAYTGYGTGYGCGCSGM